MACNLYHIFACERMRRTEDADQDLVEQLSSFRLLPNLPIMHGISRGLGQRFASTEELVHNSYGRRAADTYDGYASTAVRGGYSTDGSIYNWTIYHVQFIYNFILSNWSICHSPRVYVWVR